MNINLSPKQENFIQRQVDTGKYNSPEEVIEVALQLLDEYEKNDAQWIEDVRQKINDAILESEKTPPVDGATFVNQIINRLQQVRE